MVNMTLRMNILIPTITGDVWLITRYLNCPSVFTYFVMFCFDMLHLEDWLVWLSYSAWTKC